MTSTATRAKRAVIYKRFSSDRQNERSVDDQISFCQTIAQRAGYSLVNTYSDRAVSGSSTLNRPGFTKLLIDASERAFDVVVVEDIDRAFRDEADYHLARKKLAFNDIEMHAASGLIGRVEGSVRALLSALFLETLALHVRRGLSAVVGSGRSAGGRSYGY